MKRSELYRAVSQLQVYLLDQSSIVKTCAMQGLADLAKLNPALRSDVIEEISLLVRTGAPAMKARGKKLLR